MQTGGLRDKALGRVVPIFACYHYFDYQAIEKFVARLFSDEKAK